MTTKRTKTTPTVSAADQTKAPTTSASFDTEGTTTPINYYNSDGYLPQQEVAYTALAVVRIADGVWVLRQIDIINGEIKSIQDSKPNARAVVFEYYKTAAADIFYKEHYK